MSEAVDFPFREVGLLLSIAVFVVVSVGALAARRMNGQATPALKYGIVTLWLAAVLRLYSASSYIWAPEASEHDLFPLLRSLVLVVLTMELIFAMALVAYYWRRSRGRE